METKFIEQLVMTVPESLRETTLTLQTEVEELLKAKSTKKFLVLEPYSRNTELCRHILRRMEKLPELPSVTSSARSTTARPTDGSRNNVSDRYGGT